MLLTAESDQVSSGGPVVGFHTAAPSDCFPKDHCTPLSHPVCPLLAYRRTSDLAGFSISAPSTTVDSLVLEHQRVNTRARELRDPTARRRRSRWGCRRPGVEPALPRRRHLPGGVG